MSLSLTLHVFRHDERSNNSNQATQNIGEHPILLSKPSRCGFPDHGVLVNLIAEQTTCIEMYVMSL